MGQDSELADVVRYRCFNLSGILVSVTSLTIYNGILKSSTHSAVVRRAGLNAGWRLLTRFPRL